MHVGTFTPNLPPGFKHRPEMTKLKWHQKTRPNFPAVSGSHAPLAWKQRIRRGAVE
ncbi:hypothetical protein Pmani_040037, partial [Petrolisthes manimaculis]